MTRGQFYRDKEAYVNATCQAFIEPSEVWKSIECRHMGSDGIAYIKLVDRTDDSYYFDVTALDLSGITALVAKAIAEIECPEQVRGFEHRKAVAELFGKDISHA